MEKQFLITESQLTDLLKRSKEATSITVDEMIFEDETTLDVFINDDSTSLCSLLENVGKEN